MALSTSINRIKWASLPLYFLMLFALLYAGIHFYKDIAFIQNDQLIDDDYRQHIPAFIAEQNPEAFNDRLITDYSAAYHPPGYSWVMSGISAVTDPVTGSKYLGFALMIASLITAVMVGGKLGGMVGAAVALALIFRSELFINHVYSGLFRSFAIPLTLLHIYFLLCRRYTAVSITLVLQALFYPVLCFIYIPATFISVFPEVRKNPSWLWKSARSLLVALLGCAIILLFFSHKGQDYESLIKLADAELMCEWYETGRLPELPFPSIIQSIQTAWTTSVNAGPPGSVFIPALLTGALWQTVAAPIALLLLVVFTARTNRRAFNIFCTIALCGILIHLLARTFAFSLGFPDRYLQYALPFCIFLLWPAAWGGLLKKYPGNAYMKTLLIVLGAIICFAYPWRIPSPRDAAPDLSLSHDLMDAIRDAEEDTLFTAWPPYVLNDIPLFASREVLMNVENAHPIYMPYYRNVRTRFLDTIQMTYSTNIQEVINIRDKYKLTHLILRHRIFFKSKIHSSPVFRPLTFVGSTMRKRTSFDNMVFYYPKVEWIWHQDNSYLVIDLRKIQSPDASSAPEMTGIEKSVPLVSYSDDISLSNVSLEPAVVRPGETCVASFTWKAPMYVVTRPLTVQAHFLQSEGDSVRDNHSLFNSVDFDRVNWHASDPVTFSYQHTIKIEDGAAPGTYSLAISLLNDRTSNTIAPDFGHQISGNSAVLPVQLTIGPE